MKKIVVIAMACAMALTIGIMAGCSSSSSSSAASASGSASAASASASAASESASTASASASAASASASAAAASESASAAAATTLDKGTYTVKFDTDSTMFHVNEAHEGKATLTVDDNGQMTVHVALAGTGYTKLFLGKKDDAAKEGAVVYEFIPETVKFKDGTTDEVYAFDLPVPVLDEPFDVATYGPKKDLWYDHVVTISDPQPVQ